MSGISDVFKFERFKLGNMWGKIKDNPEQLLLGAGDPLSAKAWGGVTGKDYEPLVDQWGGATKDDYKKAEAAGIDTSAGKGMHGIARAIASVYAGGAAKNAVGAGGAANGASETSGASASAGKGMPSRFGQAMSLGNTLGTAFGKETPSGYEVDLPDYDDIDMTSDKNKKRSAKRGVRKAVERGMKGDDPIDELGVQMRQIQDLTKRIEKLKAQLKKAG